MLTLTFTTSSRQWYPTTNTLHHRIIWWARLSWSNFTTYRIPQPTKLSDVLHGLGFTHGKMFQDKYGRLITSLDGYRAYLLIIDRKSWYIWIMLAKTKQPPLTFLKKFFTLHGLTSGRRIVRADKWGELWGSFEFHQVVMDASFLLEPMAPSAPFRNAIAECPNQMLGNWMRCVLHAAGLGPEFWSFALIHVAKVVQQVWHHFIC